MRPTRYNPRPRPPPSGGTKGTRLLERLNAEAAGRLQIAYAPRSRGPLASALRAFEKFATACPGRELFKEPRALGDRAAAKHNEWTLILYATFLASTTSERTRKVVATKTIKSYISLLKGYLEHIYAFDLTERSSRLKRFLESLQAEDPRSGKRRRRRALRRRHLIRIWETVPEAQLRTPKAVNEHAMLTTAWHTLARGGEVATADLTRADLRFGATKKGERYAEVWLRPLKKRTGEHTPKAPQYILEFDGGGADTYRALRRLEKYDPVPEHRRAVTPMFRAAEQGGQRGHFTTAKLRELVRRRVRQIGEKKPREWGAQSARIGGATDLASTGQLCQLTLQAKGRWASDIGKIYARGTRRSQLETSQLMHRARGRDLEEILPNFSQPA